MQRIAVVLLCLLLAVPVGPSAAHAQLAQAPAGPPLRPGPGQAATPCPQFFAGGQAPALLNPRLAQRTRLLCFQAFAVLHSGVTRTPLWSAEHLTAASLQDARNTPRVNAFHAEDQLPPDERAELSDYARSGFDRGHMSPSGDMPDPDAQQDSFTLANMIPQNHRLNTGLWQGIESAVRTLAEQHGELYVVTGPIFQGGNLQALKGRVLVPTSVFKALFDPATGQAGAYLAPNTDRGGWQPVSIGRLAQLAGIDAFPAVSAQVKAQAMALPQPTPYDMKRNGGRDAGAGGSGERRSRHHRREESVW